jgi:hypothetical protein
MVRSKIHEDCSALFSFLTPEDFEKTHMEKDKAPFVLVFLKNAVPHAPSHVLFWQAAQNDVICAIAASDDEKFVKPPFVREENGAFSTLEKTFSSFGEAENYIMQLIAEEL